MKIIELVMIVKNSGEVLRDCLRENKKWIDHWTILDTGSTDGTPEIIKDELKDIPGKLHFGEFVDFSQARNKSLELSSKTCLYTIILDDSYKLVGGKELREVLKKAKASCFLIKIGKYVDNYLRDDYYSKRIIKSDQNLKYKFRIHEDIVVSEHKMKTILDNKIFIDDLTFESHSERSLNRYEGDIDMLLLDHKDDPKEQRTIYYLAKTYYLLENLDKALEYYSKIKQLTRAREDFLFAAYYETACINYKQNFDINTFKTALSHIEQLFKNRAEASYKLAVIYKDEGEIEKVNDIISRIITYPKPAFIGTLIENDIYEYYIPYMYIDVNIILGHLEKAAPVLKKMLMLYPNDQPMLNMKYSICDNLNISSIPLSNNKTIVFHTSAFTSLIYCWNPSGDKRISGSEYMAINLAKEFYKLGYRVFIIGTFEDKKTNINYEGIYDGIEYIDYKYFSEFALKYVIDYLIVSRFSANLVYYDNIKNVYLWMHDTLPIIDDNSKCIQYHKTKFKYIIGISEWQKQNTVKILNVPKDNIYVSRNAIYMERFNHDGIQKTPFRFIYSSAPQRGLNLLIDVIPKIKERYPKTTLHLFVNKEFIDTHTLEKIDKLDYVLLEDRVRQDQLAIEFLKSDVWFYPTNFPEAYCITALEAMASKCLVVTVDHCGLGNVAQGRGVLCKPPIKTNIDVLVDKLFFVLDKPALKEHFINKAYEWAKNQTYENLANEWIHNIF